MKVMPTHFRPSAKTVMIGLLYAPRKDFLAILYRGVYEPQSQYQSGLEENFPCQSGNETHYIAHSQSFY
jgi:hypothetical protein